MRYRALSSSGDYTFGQSQANFLVNDPAAVAQSVSTRLKLWAGEWFLDSREGTPWMQSVLGKNTKDLYDIVIRGRVLGTKYVNAITKYSSFLSPGRRLSISMTIETAFGTTDVEITLG